MTFGARPLVFNTRNYSSLTDANAKDAHAKDAHAKDAHAANGSLLLPRRHETILIKARTCDRYSFTTLSNEAIYLFRAMIAYTSAKSTAQVCIFQRVK